jgi:hypothetical protein
MIRQLFKYASIETAQAILQNRTLKWSAPELFNDPFEFKSPLELGFDWNEIRDPLVERFTRVIIQEEEPSLPLGNPIGLVIAMARQENPERDPAKARRLIDVSKLLEIWEQTTERDRKVWLEMKKKYRVLCLSAAPNNILMWSHYAQYHKGLVFAFEPKIGSNSSLLGARPVTYTKSVPVAGTMEDFLGYITGQTTQPDPAKAFENSVYTKSSDWAYENEFRIFDTMQDGESGFFSYRGFSPPELVAIYFGCRTTKESKDEITAAARSVGTPISFFNMRDERIRFELTSVPVAA